MVGMHYLALACDYDGTIATDGHVDETCIAALERCRSSGRQLVLVTGRELDHLRAVFSRLDLFARVVVENGGLVYNPQTGVERPLAESPPAAFINLLRAEGASPLSVGRVIVSTREPHEVAVLEAIHALHLEYQVIFNKGAVMVLPSGINKATGLCAALAELGIPARNVVGVGDAENDHTLLSTCGCGVAVANALPSLKARADLVTDGAECAGVGELIARLLTDDLATVAIGTHHVLTV